MTTTALKIALFVLMSSPYTLAFFGSKENTPRAVDPTQCLEEGFDFCSDCNTMAQCMASGGGFTAIPVPCSDDTLCGPGAAVMRSVVTCFASNDTSIPCACIPGEQGYYTDPYDPNQYFFCSSDGIRVSFKCENPDFVYNNETNTCEEAPVVVTPECTETGIFPVLPTCTQYYICQTSTSDPIVLDCDPGMIFNQQSGQCVTPESLSPDCTDQEDGYVVGHPQDCTAFFYCDGTGAIKGEGACCPAGKVFSEADQKCMNSGSVSCSPVECSDLSIDPPSPCSGGSTGGTGSSGFVTGPVTGGVTGPVTGGVTGPVTGGPTGGNPTTYPSIQSTIIFECSETGRFPDPADCHWYYSCVELTPGNFQMSHIPCAGSLVFNETTKECDDPANVPECN